MRKKTGLSFLAAALVIAAFLPGCTRTEKKEERVAAPDFTLSDLANKKVRLADLKGKVVLLEFWATWCPPCREAIPGLERLHEAYKGKGLAVIGVSMDDGEWEDVQAFVKEYRIAYPVLQGTEEVATAYRVRVIPTLFLIDRNGMVAKQYVGGDNDQVLEKAIRALL